MLQEPFLWWIKELMKNKARRVTIPYDTTVQVFSFVAIPISGSATPTLPRMARIIIGVDVSSIISYHLY
jgi:hypothetical protein